jgi:hypothetical protein
MMKLAEKLIKDLVLYESGKPYSNAFIDKGKKFPLQNIRNPQREAENLVKHWKVESPKARTVCLLGLSSLYIIVELLKVLGERATLIVVEPSEDILASFKASNNLTVLDPLPAQVTFISNNDESQLTKNFRIEMRKHEIFCDGMYMTPPIERLRPHLKSLQEKLNVQIRLEAMDRVTTVKFADEWLQNSIINLPEVLNGASIEQLFDKFTHTDAIVLCAGPSLSESLEVIKKRQKDCLVICVGTALKPALNAGIKPDITIVVDSDPVVFKQFQNIEHFPGWFVGKYTIFPGLPQLYKNKFISFNSVLTQDFSEWLAEGGFKYGTLNIGGTVALSAIDCALKLGARNIFLFGLDLAYAEDGTSHAKNSVYDGNKTNNGLIKVQGNRHKEVATTKQFANYIHILDRYFKDIFSVYTGKIFNVNNHGAQFQHIDLLSPKEAEHLIQKSDDNLAENFNLARQVLDPNKLSGFLTKSLEELKSIKETADSLLKRMNNKNIPDDLPQFEEDIKNSNVTKCFLSSALQGWCLQISNNPDRNPHEMSVDLVKQVSGATDWVIGLLENSLLRFLKQTQGVKNGAQ